MASHRPHSWAKFLIEKGHSVSVLTTDKKDIQHNEKLDLSLEGMSIIEVSEFQLLLTARKHQHKQQQSSDGLLNKIRQKTGIFSACRMPDITDSWAFMAYNRISKEKKWDLVISSLGPYTVHGIAMKMKKKGLTKHWIADYRDLWSEHDKHNGLFPFTLIERVLEKKWLKHADLLTTVSDGLKVKLQKLNSRVPIHVVMNGFNPELMDSAPEIKIQRDKFTIVYTGTIYPHKQDPTSLFKAINQILQNNIHQKNTLELLFYGNRTSFIERLIKKHQLEGVIKQMGQVNQIESFSIQKSADALLLLEDPQLLQDEILTGKLFEYLYSGKPIIGIGIDNTSAPGKIIEETASGLACGTDLEKITSFLNSILNGSYQNMQNREAVMKYTRENQAKLFYSLCL